MDYKYKRNYEFKRTRKLKKISTIFIYFDIIICILNKFFSYLRSVINIKIISDADISNGLGKNSKKIFNLKKNSPKSRNILNLRKIIIYYGYFQNYLIVETVIPKLA